MKKNRNAILTLLTIFVLFPFFINSAIAIEDPDYTETISPGSALYFNFNLDEGDTLTIEFEVISGGNKDIDLYIENSNGDRQIMEGLYQGQLILLLLLMILLGFIFLIRFQLLLQRQLK